MAAQQSLSYTFLSKRLQEMAVRLQERYQVDCTSANPGSVDGCPLVVQQDQARQINHIGIKLFDDKLMAQNPSPVYHFAERYLLQLLLLREDSLISRTLREDKVTLRIRESGSLSSISTRLTAVLPVVVQCPSLIVTTDNSRYTVAWQQGNATLLLLRFPIQYELLWGMNKKEVEGQLYHKLLFYRQQASTRQAADTVPQPAEYELTPWKKDISVREGDYYGVATMNGNAYYRQAANGKYIPLCDKAFPEESVQNLFTLQADKRMQINITQNLYSRKKMKFELPLQQLMDFFRSTGCDVCAGIETIEKGEVTGTVVLRNAAAGFNHMLFFTMDLRALSSPGHYKIEAQLYAYVPTHNIQNLFYDNNIIQKQNEK